MSSKPISSQSKSKWEQVEEATLSNPIPIKGGVLRHISRTNQQVKALEVDLETRILRYKSKTPGVKSMCIPLENVLHFTLAMRGAV